VQRGAGDHRGLGGRRLRLGALGQKSGARQTLASSEDQGEVFVRADPARAPQGYDSRSHARKMLESIETALEGFAATR
jgi:hypothetical protein